MLSCCENFCKNHCKKQLFPACPQKVRLLRFRQNFEPFLENLNFKILNRYWGNLKIEQEKIKGFLKVFKLIILQLTCSQVIMN